MFVVVFSFLFFLFLCLFILSVLSRDCPIVPVMIGDAAKATKLADELLKHGIYVIGFSYPVSPYV
jgi:7-keto-8-aminopelargonate synthetase-like enzyme